MGLFKRFLQRFKRIFPIFGGNSEYGRTRSASENETVLAVADCIGRNLGKLMPTVTRNGEKANRKNDRLQKLLQLRPAPELTTYDFLYRIGSDLVLHSNAFAIIFFNETFTEIIRIQPVAVSSYDISEDENDNLFFRFTWAYDNKEYVVPYDFVIHIKSKFCKNRFSGISPDYAIKDSSELLDVTYRGIKNAVNNSAQLRGYIQFNTIADEDDLKEKVSEFQRAYMSAENNGGIAAIDSTMSFHEISQQPKPIPVSQIDFLRDNILRFYGISDKILKSEYTESEWNAFYEAIIEPIVIQLTQEFTYKLLTSREREFGNEIAFTSDRLQYASLQTRSEIGLQLFDRGAITIDEYRRLLYLPPLDEGGDVRQVSLNYVRTDEQTAYQGG